MGTQTVISVLVFFGQNNNKKEKVVRALCTASSCNTHVDNFLMNLPQVMLL
jgi:hypothetical protein